MAPNLIKFSTVAILASVVVAALTGCTINVGAAEPSAKHGMMGHNANSSEYSATEIMFAQMMIPHHQQALEMSSLAESRAVNKDVKRLAAEIAAEQAPEITMFEQWLEQAGASTMMDHDMGKDGMLSEEQMKQLEASTGLEFEKLFLEGMILHHKGAIDMAQMIQDSSNAEVKSLAKSIIDSQSSQITYMESLLAK